MEQTRYSETEKQVLKTVLEKPDFTRWASLCSLMSDGIYIASETHDRDLPRCGWLHICARYLAILPKRVKRDSRLATNEFLAKEIDSYCEQFRSVVRSFQHYMDTIYPNFDSRTGKWSRAGEEDKDLNPFPFFLSDYIYWEGDNSEDNDDGIVALSLLFEPIPKFGGDVFKWEPSFFTILARITDDYDAELEFGDFAGNVDEEEIREIVQSLDMSGKDDISKNELDRVARIMVDSYNATLEMHQSILDNVGKGRFANDHFDRSRLFHSCCIQAVLVVFQPRFVEGIERCGLQIQQYNSSICSTIDIANKVEAAWQNFFSDLKRQFCGDPLIVSAESVALSMVNHYAMKIASEGGDLHISAETINAEYVSFIEKFERISQVVAQHDYSEVKDSNEKNVKGAIMTKSPSTVNNFSIQNCQTVQVNNDQSKGMQITQDDSKESKSNVGKWIIGIVGSIIATIVGGWVLKRYF